MGIELKSSMRGLVGLLVGCLVLTSCGGSPSNPTVPATETGSPATSDPGTDSATTNATPVLATTDANPVSATSGSTTSGSATGDAPTDTGPANGEATDTAPSSGSSTSGPHVSGSPSFTPVIDAEPVDGDCPYLSKAQVESDTGQRMGQPRTRPATPLPVCDFVRSDGTFLATVRVLQFGSDTEAVAAVDFYVPREASNPEAKPAGWAGGSLVVDGHPVYGVSKGTIAVIVTLNTTPVIGARLLAVDAINALGI